MKKLPLKYKILGFVCFLALGTYSFFSGATWEKRGWTQEDVHYFRTILISNQKDVYAGLLFDSCAIKAIKSKFPYPSEIYENKELNEFLSYVGHPDFQKEMKKCFHQIKPVLLEGQKIDTLHLQAK
ncbi:MAG: hypothetical protein MUC49_21300 [Raineya sp.]|jgi:hypothetical protein|nr:hypothetical protein [Raineya sp.]